MDPSERLEFERELQKDENLLIELETLKKTAGCLTELRCIDPPQSIVNRVKNEAASNSRKGSDTGSYRYLLASAAITLAAVMVYGILYVQDQQSLSGSETANNGTSQATISSTGSFSPVSANSRETNDDVSPWVDHDEVIHFHERFNRGSVASVDSMFNNSLQKLTRVQPSGAIQQVQQQIHLTGSNR
jgi:hypothetical protein